MLKINFLKKHSNARCPEKAKEGDAGYDLFTPEGFKLAPFERKIIPTGIAVEIPQGYYGKICDRSGHAAKRGIHILAGVIDSGYRGEVGVVAVNLNGRGWLESWLSAIAKDDYTNVSIDRYFGSSDMWEVKAGDAIAQIIFRKYEDVNFEEVSVLSDSQRAEGGWGHSRS
jgi:dUTP pyrophosphatase